MQFCQLKSTAALAERWLTSFTHVILPLTESMSSYCIRLIRVYPTARAQYVSIVIVVIHF